MEARADDPVEPAEPLDDDGVLLLDDVEEVSGHDSHDQEDDEQKIWRWGRSKDAPELIELACGQPFDATPYCEYLAKKFGALYAL